MLLPRFVTDLRVRLCGLGRQPHLPFRPLAVPGQMYMLSCGEGHQLTLQVACVAEDGAVTVRRGPSFPAGSSLALSSLMSCPSLLALLRTRPAHRMLDQLPQLHKV